MKGALFIMGRALQLIGMGTVLIAFLTFFTNPDMKGMVRATLVGIVEFYVGNFIVARTGEKSETSGISAEGNSYKEGKK